MPELSPTGRVILGLICAKPQSGYEIKQLVDNSARFFWAASYGQIYPELRRLEAAGLITAHDDPAGGRARVRWSITATGRRALVDWLTADDGGGTYELRDEGMLRLFFLDAVPEDERAGVLERVAARHRAVLAQLEGVRALAATAPSGYPTKVLETGIAYHSMMAERFAALAKEQ